MRARVDSFEALDERGVPEAQYDRYMDVFNAYNDSVEVYEVRAEQLRSADAACRGVIEGHNALSDSLNQVLRDAGIEIG